MSLLTLCPYRAARWEHRWIRACQSLHGMFRHSVGSSSGENATRPRTKDRKGAFELLTLMNQNITRQSIACTSFILTEPLGSKSLSQGVLGASKRVQAGIKYKSASKALLHDAWAWENLIDLTLGLSSPAPALSFAEDLHGWNRRACLLFMYGSISHFHSCNGCTDSADGGGLVAGGLLASKSHRDGACSSL